VRGMPASVCQGDHPATQGGLEDSGESEVGGMIKQPKTRAEAEKLIYGCGISKRPYDPAHCADEVNIGDSRWSRYAQCSRKPGHGPDGLFCKQHDPAYIQRKRDEREKKWNEQYARAAKANRITGHAYEMLALLREAKESRITDDWLNRVDKLLRKLEGDV
jgi:hypothetical protein